MNSEDIKQMIVELLKSQSPTAQNLFWQDIFDLLKDSDLQTPKFLSNSRQEQVSMPLNQERFRKIVESFPLPIVVTDQHGFFTYINPAFNQMFGYTIDDIPNDKKWSLNAYPDIEYRNEILQTVSKANYNPKAPRERRIVCKNGDIKEIIMQDIIIGTESLTFFQDLTAQRSSEREVQRKDQEYREIVENIRDMIFLVDNQLKIIKINPAVVDILGYSKLELLNCYALDFIAKESHPLVTKMVKLKKSGLLDKTLYEVDLKLKAGGTIPVEVVTRIISKDENQIGTLIIARDISERKKITEERYRQQKIESIGLLAGGIAHDFNNILVSILGNIDLLQLDNSNFTQEQMEICEELDKATIQARDLAKQLLTFSKGGVPILKAVNIENLVHDTASFVLRGSNCKTQITLEPFLPHVKIDSGQINQVFHNLLLNARQAMPKGGIIAIDITQEQIFPNSPLPIQDGNYVKISIQDQGIGIPKALQHKIFDPYFTTKIGGNGLGLTMSYSIVKNHGGHIDFSSEVNKGTIFNVYLPVTSKKESLQESKGNLTLNQNQGKILVLDDDPKIHSFLKRVFTKWGFHMTSCYDGSEVFALFEEFPLGESNFDLIFMDLTIPGGIGGKDTIQKVLKKCPLQNVIVFSGYSEDPILANHKEYGFCDYLIKPFTINELKKLCEKWT